MKKSDSQDQEFFWNTCPLAGCGSLPAAESLNSLTDQFSDQNIRFKWIDHWAGPGVMSGDYPGLFRHGGDAQAISARSLGAHTKVIGIETDHDCDGIAVLVDSPIKAMKDLKGKTLALPAEVFEGSDPIIIKPHLRIISCLEANGLDVNDVQLVRMAEVHGEHELAMSSSEAQRIYSSDDFPLTKALFSGEVDAMRTSSQQAGRLIVEGKIRMLYDLMEHPELPRTTIITVRDEIIENYPDVVKQFLMVEIKVARWGRAHRNELIKLMAQNSGVSEEAIIRGYSSDFHMRLVPEFTNENIKALKYSIELMKRHGLIKKDFDVDRWLEPKSLEQALVALGD